MRQAFLYLSRNNTVRHNLMRLPLAERAARRFVAGETPEDAIRVARELNGMGILATLNYLGENVTSPDQATAATSEYLYILDKIAESGVNANVSVKLTQLGLNIAFDAMMSNLRTILDRARSHDNFVRIDMEDSLCTERTLQAYEQLREEGYDNVGVVLQAYLYRTQADIRRLIPRGANIRLCKGAYREPPAIAFPRKADVNLNYVACLELLFSAEARAHGVYVAVATHDERMIGWAKALTAREGVTKDDYEFQMLYGVRRDLQLALAREGYKVRVYVPYGTEWYPYFMRRLAERPANVLFVVRSVLQEAWRPR